MLSGFNLLVFPGDFVSVDGGVQKNVLPLWQVQRALCPNTLVAWRYEHRSARVASEKVSSAFLNSAHAMLLAFSETVCNTGQDVKVRKPSQVRLQGLRHYVAAVSRDHLRAPMCG